MGARSPKKRTDEKALLLGLRELIGLLPTANERREMQEHLETLIEFLTTMKRHVETLPAAEDLAGAETALARLEEMADQAHAQQVLAMVGLRGRSTGARRKSPSSEEKRARARETLERLEGLSVEEVRSRLEPASAYSVTEIRAIAKELGIGSPAKLKREALVHQIATKLANYQGYRLLGDHS